MKKIDGDTVTLGNPWGSRYPDLVLTREEFGKTMSSPQALDLSGAK